MLSTSGATIGPPEDNEYAVDPVGVEIINPSDRYSETLLLFTNSGWNIISANGATIA